VYFNGRRAHDIYRRVVLPSLTDAYASLPLAILPSTSPAHAALSLDRKLATWKAFIGDTVRMHTECTAE
jgi:G:T/U-mismatch repair DNA glycosylase